MSIPRPKEGDVVLMWKGAITGSPYPVPDEEKDDPAHWVEAEVLETPRHRSAEKQSQYLVPMEGDHFPKWVPPAGWKEKPDV